MIKHFLRRAIGIQSPSAMWNSPEVRRSLRDGFEEGMARAAMGPHGPPLFNGDGTPNPEGIRIFAEETAPLVEKLRPAARMAIWSDTAEDDER